MSIDNLTCASPVSCRYYMSPEVCENKPYTFKSDAWRTDSDRTRLPLRSGLEPGTSLDACPGLVSGMLPV